MGIGYDSHRFVGGRPLILGGVTIPHTQGLAGHSDADAVAHALIDAMLGACGLGDVGRLFPDTDAAHKDADSMLLLAETVRQIRAAGWKLQQADLSIIAEQPKIAPHALQMQARLASVAGVDASSISVKAKTNEGMGFVGRGEGVAVMAVATLIPA